MKQSRCVQKGSVGFKTDCCDLNPEYMIFLLLTLSRCLTHHAKISYLREILVVLHRIELIYSKCMHTVAITIIIIITREHQKGSETGSPTYFYRLCCEVGPKDVRVKSLYKISQISNNPSRHPAQQGDDVFTIMTAGGSLFSGDAELESFWIPAPQAQLKRGDVK